jgi:hypothetical protein
MQLIHSSNLLAKRKHESLNADVAIASPAATSVFGAIAGAAMGAGAGASPSAVVPLTESKSSPATVPPVESKAPAAMGAAPKKLSEHIQEAIPQLPPGLSPIIDSYTRPYVELSPSSLRVDESVVTWKQVSAGYEFKKISAPPVTYESSSVDIVGTYAVAIDAMGTLKFYNRTTPDAKDVAICPGLRFKQIASKKSLYRNGVLALSAEGAVLRVGRIEAKHEAPAHPDAELHFGKFDTYAIKDGAKAIAIADGSYPVILDEIGRVHIILDQKNNDVHFEKPTETTSFGFPDTFPSPPVAVATHATSYYVLLANGDVYAWGFNASGQLGIGKASAISSEARPVKMLVSNIQQIAAGDNFVLLRDTQGRLYAAGSNVNDELGFGPAVKMVLTPTLVPIDCKVTEVLAEDKLAVAVCEDQRIRLFGNPVLRRKIIEALGRPDVI